MSEKPLWTPSQEAVSQANLTRFMGLVSDQFGVNLSNYSDLYSWSIEKPAQFWETFWHYSGVVFQEQYQNVLSNPTQMPGAKWFNGAKLNFAENLLRYRDDELAIIFRGENGKQRTLTYRELYIQVSRVSSFLKSIGVKPNDRIVGYLPNLPETIIAMLAATSLGAIWSSCSPDFGTNGVLDRFGQIEPKVLFTVDGYRYNGKDIDCRGRTLELKRKLPSLETVIVHNFLGLAEERELGAVTLESVLSAQADEIIFSYHAFNHPLYIMYSSGTTGVPKCIVHGAGGTLIQHLKEHLLHTDLKRQDRMLYFTTCGWMMWNWLVSALATGATVVLYDGSPFYPNGNVLFDYIDHAEVTVFGTSAKYIAALEKAGLEPKSTHRLRSLRTILSTGSPLAPESFDYVYRSIKTDLCLSSISGGTDIISCFALGNPIGPVYRGELQTRGLGMDVRVFSEEGHELVAKKGELVCVKPFPSMPIGFWNDPDGKKYNDSYFNVFPNVWRHGDYVELRPNGGMVIYGRSDAVLNPGGVRIGTAELYAQVEQLEEIVESVAVGQDWKGDERVVLFVRLRDNLVLDQQLKEKIGKQIRANLTPRHVPAKIIQVTDIPRTVSGKITELAIKNIIHGRPVKNTEALANPNALEQFKNIPVLGED